MGALEDELAAVADEDFGVEWYLRQIQAGRVRVFHAFAEGLRVGIVLWRIDQQDWGREFVIVAAVGWSEKFDLTASVYPRLDMMAKGMGCKSARFHTQRRGLVKKMEAHGFSAAEYVMRKHFA